MTMVGIVPFATLTFAQAETAASILVQSFAHLHSAWKTQDEARAEIANLTANPEWTGFAAVEDTTVVGWAGGIQSHPTAWELHPLVVAPDCQRRGVGKSLVGAVEAAARVAGALTLYLGSDDDFGGTSAYGADLYRDIPSSISDLTLTAGSPHPLAFYRKLGFVVVGLIPDANGRGCPDIWLAKRM